MRYVDPTHQPGMHEIIARAIVDTDFLAELVPNATRHDIETTARIAADQACEAWEGIFGYPPATVSDRVRDAAIAALIRHASIVLAHVEAEVSDALENAIADAADAGMVRYAH